MTASSSSSLVTDTSALGAITSPWGTADQRVVQRRNKHDALLATAARLFKQQGFASTSLDHIAVQLGITKPTLYHYVGSKALLVQGCAEKGFELALQAVQQPLYDRVNDGVRQALKGYAQVVASDFGWCMVRVEEWSLATSQRQPLQRQRHAIEQCLQAALAPHMSAAMVLRAMEGVALSLPRTQWAALIDALLAADAGAAVGDGVVLAALPRTKAARPSAALSGVATRQGADAALPVVQEPATVHAHRAVETVPTEAAAAGVVLPMGTLGTAASAAHQPHAVARKMASARTALPHLVAGLPDVAQPVHAAVPQAAAAVTAVRRRTSAKQAPALAQIDLFA